MSRFNQLCLGFILNCPVFLFAQEIEYRDGDTTPVVYRDISKTTERSGETKPSIYTDFKTPDLNEFQALLKTSSNPKLKVRRLLSGKMERFSEKIIEKVTS
ncbi:hypothetical protein C4G38_RS21125 [Vibrio parahaemolyticus]|nr:hypothetical protein [Vibrio parahaemolyticus]EJG0739919.1 hypothetical protein [Vibrio parahaemolyticus]EJG0918479.1 hypothetical protein [Vibrio parahaemolyticus]